MLRILSRGAHIEMPCTNPTVNTLVAEGAACVFERYDSTWGNPPAVHLISVIRLTPSGFSELAAWDNPHQK